MCEYSSVHKIPRITGRCLKISVKQRPLDSELVLFRLNLLKSSQLVNLNC